MPVGGQSPLRSLVVVTCSRSGTRRSAGGEAGATAYSTAFKGISDYVVLCANTGAPPIPFMTDFSVALWVRFPDPIQDGVIFSALGTLHSHGGYYLATEGGLLKFADQDTDWVCRPMIHGRSDRAVRRTLRECLDPSGSFGSQLKRH